MQIIFEDVLPNHILQYDMICNIHCKKYIKTVHVDVFFTVCRINASWDAFCILGYLCIVGWIIVPKIKNENILNVKFSYSYYNHDDSNYNALKCIWARKYGQ